MSRRKQTHWPSYSAWRAVQEGRLTMAPHPGRFSPECPRCHGGPLYGAPEGVTVDRLTLPGRDGPAV